MDYMYHEFWYHHSNIAKIQHSFVPSIFMLSTKDFTQKEFLP
jgi:hypothetical protein